MPFALNYVTCIYHQCTLRFSQTRRLTQRLSTQIVRQAGTLARRARTQGDVVLGVFRSLHDPLFTIDDKLSALRTTPRTLPTLLPTLRRQATFLHHLARSLFLTTGLRRGRIVLGRSQMSLKRIVTTIYSDYRRRTRGGNIILRTPPTSRLPI